MVSFACWPLHCSLVMVCCILLTSCNRNSRNTESDYKVFFSKALSTSVEREHLTIVVPKDADLIDGVYVDEDADLPVEIHCASEGDRAALAFHLTFRPDSPTARVITDERFKLLHDQTKLAQAFPVCVVEQKKDGSKVRATTVLISSAEIKFEGE